MIGRLFPLLLNADLDLCLATLGILLVYLEFNIPGTVLPGAIGTLLFSLALYGLYQLPLHPPAIGFLSGGILLILMEIRVPTRDLLAILGTANLIYGLATLVEDPASPHLVTAIATGTLFGATTLALGRIAMQARRNKAIR